MPNAPVVYFCRAKALSFWPCLATRLWAMSLRALHNPFGDDGLGAGLLSYTPDAASYTPDAAGDNLRTSAKFLQRSKANGGTFCRAVQAASCVGWP